MSTARQKQLLLLKEATDDIQKIGRDWAANGLELPVVFLVDWQDRWTERNSPKPTSPRRTWHQLRRSVTAG